MSSLSRKLVAAVLFASLVRLHAADATSQSEHGKALFQQHCFLCHLATGQGAPGVFPPLAKSDYLMADKQRSIRILCEGLNGEIVVNGVKYNGQMPPSTLNDQEAADVLTYARTAWSNSGEPVTADEVREERKKTRFKTYEDLVRASAYAPLPKAPDGFMLRDVVHLPENPTRLAGDGKSDVLYVLANSGNVWRVDAKGGSFRLLLRGERYIDKPLGNPSCTGMMLDPQRRLYIVVNQRNEKATPVTDEVTIFRTTDVSDGDPFDPQPWLRASYPWGIGPFNHCVNHLALGPDGFLYVNSGSRTDGGEPGKDPKYSAEGETPLTACMWRLDPKAAKPEIEIFARGLRNSFGFCWSDKGELVATENGPDYDMPEELNVIERGRHYGFPFQFADSSQKPYPHTPDTPTGQKFTRPVANLGPDGGFDGQPIYTFDPHSSPAGIVFLGNDFPEGWRGTFLITRFGNLLKKPRDVGFDLLQAKLKLRADGTYEATMKTAIAPMARPIDIIQAGPGRLFIAEYTRPLDHKSGLPQLPGRILELAVRK
jgi:mono/diheme cytochrome c family protein